MIKHLKDENYDKEIINSKGICLVDFYANWCGPCMRLAPILEQISSSRANCNIMKVNVDENPNCTNRLKIDTIPTICIYKDGKLINKYVGYLNKSELLKLIEEVSFE